MSRDKQIEEMAKYMLEESTSANVEPVLEMEGKEFILGENATKILNNILEQAFIPFLAEKLYAKGYRKASEVAREIFEEIEEEIEEALKSNYKVLPQLEFSNELYNSVRGKIDALRGIEGFIADLKKKYTEEER